MNKFESKCPDQHSLQQFILGHLSVAEIEVFENHLSECAPCIETVENLKVGDTFSNIASEAFQDEANSPRTVDDSAIVNDLINVVEEWSVHTGGDNGVDEVSMDRAAEVQRLIREPIELGDLGAIGHFRLIRLIGTGSTGIVYLSVDTKLDRHCVLKVLRPSLGEPARKRFIAEAKATAAIHHPNVVTIFEVGSDGPLSYIAMQWIPGQTLEQKLVDQKTLSVDTTRRLALEIAKGLAAAHDQSLIHRDIKPANVWIPDGDEPAKILDFGLVRVNDEDPQLTCTGMIAGTPCFMSPEQSRGDSLDPRSDLFSLGCLMYQSLTGKLPFRSDNALATLRSIQQDHPIEPNTLDPGIDQDTSDLVMCLLAKSPNRRPESAQVLIRALQTDPNQWEFELNQPTEAKSKNQAKPASAFWKTVAALLAGIGLAAIGFIYGQQIVRIAMGTGEIIIDTKVDDVKIEIVGEDNNVKIIDLATNQSMEIEAGKYKLQPVGDQNSISIDKNVLTLSRGETEIVSITRVDNATASGSSTALIRELKVVPIDHSNPEEVIMTLENQLSGHSQMETLKLDFDKRQNQIYLAGAPDLLEIAEALIAKLDQPAKNTTFDHSAPYKVSSGDVLGIFIDGVLGAFDEQPPIHNADSVNGLPPALGFPITVEYSGKITLPFVEPISVDGMTIDQIRSEIKQSYFGGDTPLLRDQARILVSLLKPKSGGTQPKTSFAEGTASTNKQEKSKKVFNIHQELEDLKTLWNSFEDLKLIAETRYPIPTNPSVPIPADILKKNIELAENAIPILDKVANDAERLLSKTNDFQFRSHLKHYFSNATKTAKNARESLIEYQKEINSGGKGVDAPDAAQRTKEKETPETLPPEVTKQIQPAQIPSSENSVGANSKQLAIDNFEIPSIPPETIAKELQYNGFTYQQLLNLVRTERDLKKLNPAIAGLMNLARGDQVSEMLHAVMRSADEPVRIADEEDLVQYKLMIRQLFESLDLNELTELFVDELAKGTKNSLAHFFSERPVTNDNKSQAYFFPHFRRILSTKQGVAKEETGIDSMNKILQAMNKYSGDDVKKLKQVFGMVTSEYFVYPNKVEKYKLTTNPNLQAVSKRYFDLIIKDAEPFRHDQEFSYIARMNLQLPAIRERAERQLKAVFDGLKQKRKTANELMAGAAGGGGLGEGGLGGSRGRGGIGGRGGGMAESHSSNATYYATQVMRKSDLAKILNENFESYKSRRGNSKYSRFDRTFEQLLASIGFEQSEMELFQTAKRNDCELTITVNQDDDYEYSIKCKQPASVSTTNIEEWKSKYRLADDVSLEVRNGKLIVVGPSDAAKQIEKLIERVLRPEPVPPPAKPEPKK